jgi:phosphoadenosine phosphosulfate reductase
MKLNRFSGHEGTRTRSGSLRCARCKPNRAGDIVSEDKISTRWAVVFCWSDADMEDYLKHHDLPNEWDYFDPAKADEKRECGLHAAWGGKAVVHA